MPSIPSCLHLQVVYSLHTKNDENEEHIEALRADYDKEKEQLQSDYDARLKEWNEERSKNRDLQTRMSDLQREKETLAIEHVRPKNETHNDYTCISCVGCVL